MADWPFNYCGKIMACFRYFVEAPGYEAPKMESLGRLLFDHEENWIYDGDKLKIDEQEVAAEFITGHRGPINRLIEDIL